MAKRIKVKPAYKGLIVRDPISKNILPESGDLRSMTSYWRRRIMDGSVIVVEEKVIQKEPENKMENKKPENKSFNSGVKK